LKGLPKANQRSTWLRSIMHFLNTSSDRSIA
jgi:hypothetical protein